MKFKNADITIETTAAIAQDFAASFCPFDDFTIAKEILTNIIIKKDSADAYYLIGKILYEQDDNLGALSFVKKAISIDPGHEEANEFYLELKN